MTYQVVVIPMKHKPYQYKFCGGVDLQAVVDNVEQTFAYMNTDIRKIASMVVLVDHQVVDSYNGKWLLGKGSHASSAGQTSENSI